MIPPAVSFLALMLLLSTILASRARFPLHLSVFLLPVVLIAIGLALWVLARRFADDSVPSQLLKSCILFLAAGAGMGSELLFRPILLRFSNLLALAICVACIALLRKTSSTILFAGWLLAFLMALNIVLIKAFSF